MTTGKEEKNMRQSIWTLAFLLPFVLTGCRNGGDKQVKPRPVNVKVMVASAGIDRTGERFPGTVEEESGTQLSFSVAGTVQAVRFRLGQRIAKGQLLAALESATFRSDYDAARAALEQAEDAYARMKELHEKGSLPEIQWVETQSRLRQARAAEETAGKNLKDCRLLAPFSGVIADKSVEPGQNVTPGMPVAKLVTAGLLKVRIAVPEAEIAEVFLTQRAEIIVPALGGKAFAGTVTEKGIAANPISRSYEVKIRVENADAELMPGMVTEVSLERTGDAAVPAQCVIPANIVQLDEENNSFVWVEQDGKAGKRIIRCGAFTANGVIVEAGVEDGTRIIVEGQQKVCEGTPLTIIYK